MQTDLDKVARLLQQKFLGSECGVADDRQSVGIMIGPDHREAAQISSILKHEVGVSSAIVALGSRKSGTLGIPDNNVVVIPASELTESTINSLNDMHLTRVLSTPVHEIEAPVVHRASTSTPPLLRRAGMTG